MDPRAPSPPRRLAVPPAPQVPAPQAGSRATTTPVHPVAAASAGAGSSPPSTVAARPGVHTTDTLPGFLFIFSSPLVDERSRPMDNLDHAAETEILRETLATSRKRLRFVSQVATRTNFLRLMAIKRKFRVLHYSGHGMASGLAFETETGSADNLDCDTLKKFLGTGTGLQVQLAFVSACYSESIGEILVGANVPHVVAVRWDQEVPDTMCQAFERGFYTMLFEGHTVKTAFEMAELYAKVDRGHFCLLPRGANHDVPIFADAVEGDYEDDTPELPQNTCDSVPTYLIGRNRHVQTVVGLLCGKPRFVTIRGPPGIGKTCVALKVAKYLNTRHKFSAGVYMVPMGGTMSEALPPGAAGAATPPRVHAYQRVANELGMAGVRSDVDVLEQLQVMSASGRLLLVLDDCPSPSVPPGDDADDKGYRARGGSVDEDEYTSLLTFLNKIHARTEKVSVLMTAEASINDGHLFDVSKVVDVDPLAAIEAAKLFASLFPRNLKLREMGADSVETAIPQFADSAIIKALQGHPRAIAFAAAKLGDEDLSTLDHSLLEGIVEEAKLSDPRNFRHHPPVLADELPDESPVFSKSASTESSNAEVLAARRHVLEIDVSTTLKDMNARRLWMSMGPKETVTWGELREALDESYRERVPRAAYLRKLTDSDYHFLQSKCMKEARCDFVSTQLSIDGFAAFWKWLGPVLDLISRVHRLWGHTSPVLLTGFVNNETARRMLAPALQAGIVGAFLLRFSDGNRAPTKPGWLAVSFVCSDRTQLTIRHTAIEPTREGFRLGFESGAESVFPTLQALLMGVDRLKALFPGGSARGTPKDLAFTNVDTSGPYAALPAHMPPPPEPAGRLVSAGRSASWHMGTSLEVPRQENEM